MVLEEIFALPDAIKYAIVAIICGGFLAIPSIKLDAVGVSLTVPSPADFINWLLSGFGATFGTHLEVGDLFIILMLGFVFILMLFLGQMSRKK